VPEFKYHAFLSYSHVDRRAAAWLHRALEGYAVPRRLVEQGAPPRLTPIFRDRDELASAADLGLEIEAALAASGALIVLCSPAAARSHWVDAEVRRFLDLGRRDRIFCALLDGEPNAATRGFDPALESLPPALRAAAGFEPLAADLRPDGDGRHGARLKLVAGLLSVGLDELRRRDLQRRNRRLAWLATGSAAGVVLTSALAVTALVARNEAETNRMRAEREAETARRTTDFMVGLFDVVDPGEARGRSVTAYEILERGVSRISSELDREPAVRATLLETMGRVYTGLGLYPRAGELLESALADRRASGDAEAVDTVVALADARYLAGHYDDAETLYRTALARLASADAWSTGRSNASNGLADVLVQRARYDEAIALYRASLDRDAATFGRESAEVGRTANGLATALLYAGDLDGAGQSYGLALDAYRTALGADHPKVAETINNLGAVRYFAGDRAGAEVRYREALPLYRRLYGERHPEVAMILNNLGRIALERGDVDAALPLLEESVSIDRSLERSDHDDFIFALASLGLAHRARGELDVAGELLAEAGELATRHRHRLRGPILVDEADVLCASGRPRAALPLLEDAEPLVAATYPDEPWRKAILDSVLGYCLNALGDERGEALMRAALEPIAARWGADALFSRAARSRLDGR
jgi:tetratricopeptide (TPR) repeat protein